MTEIRFVDTTLRDGQQSLWALRMRAGAMLPAMADIDAAGFDGVEFAVPVVSFRRSVNDLREDPWIWMKQGTEIAERTPLRLHGGAKSPFQKVPESVEHLMLDRIRDLGITVTRTSDWWNNYERLAGEMRILDSYGIKTVANIIYSSSPRHTLDYYRQKTREAVAAEPYRLCFKDVGGLLTPEMAREVIPVVLENAGDLEVEFHAHCNSGLAPYCIDIAIECGVRIVHTAIPPLANQYSQPSVFDIADNVRAGGHTADLDVDALTRVRRHLEQVAQDEDLPVGVPSVYDAKMYEHQVPGGMRSNLHFQLEAVGMGDRIDETLEETARVREEFGFPIMVTPLSQFVASQAAINVTSTARYEAVTDEVIEYALGYWGEEAIEVMDPEIRSRILDRDRAAEIARLKEQSDPEPSLDELRRSFGGNVSDEELLTRVYSGVGPGRLDLDDVDPPRSYQDYQRARGSFLYPIAEQLRGSNVRDLHWRRGGFSMCVRRGV